jgi:hypothetical protein
MPFTKHQIDPAHVDTMRSVLHAVCDALHLKGEKGDPMTEIIADRIIALWRTGEHDPDRMVSRVLDDLADDMDEQELAMPTDPDRDRGWAGARPSLNLRSRATFQAGTPTSRTAHTGKVAFAPAR